MAIQNFISGGFYGKLGAMVGQRWRNKRTLRRYVVPFNPQTPKQQANRSSFAQGVALAQEAMNLNKGVDLWYIEAVPEFSARVGQASRELALGKSPAVALPIFPLNTVLSSLHTSATALSVTGEPPHQINVAGATAGDLGEFITVVKIFNSKTNKWETLYQTAECYDQLPLEVSIDLYPWHYLKEGSYISGARTFEAAFPTIREEIKQVPISEPENSYRRINLTNNGWTNTGGSIVFSLTSDKEIWFDPKVTKGRLLFKRNGQYEQDYEGSVFEWVGGKDWTCTMLAGPGITYDEYTGYGGGAAIHYFNGLQIKVFSPALNPWP